MSTHEKGGAVLKRIAAALLLTLGSWVSFSAAHAQTSWEFEPVLRLLDGSGANELAAPEGAYSIPYANRNTEIRLGFSIRVTQTGVDNTRAGGVLGFERIEGTFVFETTGTATTTDPALDSATVHLAAPDTRSAQFGPGPQPSFSVKHPVEAGVWNFSWLPDITPAPSDGTDLEKLRGAWCVPATGGDGATCEVNMGYLAFTPKLPPGGGMTVRVAGADGQGNMTVNEFQRTALFIGESFNYPSPGVTMTQEQPALTLDIMDIDTTTVWVVEGGDVVFRVRTTTGEPLEAAATITPMWSPGAPPVDAEDFMLPTSVTMAMGMSHVDFTLMAREDGFEESKEYMNVYIGASGGAIVSDDSPMTTVAIANLRQVETSTPIDIPPDGDKEGFEILPEGQIVLNNLLDNTVAISQDDEGSPVMLRVTGPEGDPNPLLIGTKISIPAEVVADDIASTTVGLRLDVTLDNETPSIAAAQLATELLPFGYVTIGDKAIDIDMALEGGHQITDPVHVCMIPDPSQLGVPALFRFDGTDWVAMGESDLSEEATDDDPGLVCGTTTEFSAFVLLYQSTAVPDMEVDGDVDSGDALFLYYAYLLRSTLGTGR